jgi:LysM repeat protein
MRKRPSTTIFRTPVISVKRRPPVRGFLKRIHAVTRGRNQRVAAAATAGELEEEHTNSRIARGLFIIFGVHILAIGLYFFHLHFLSNRTDAPKGTAAVRTEPQAPLINPQDRKEMIARGDTYASIAARTGVDEASLRAANNNCALNAGNQLIIPSKRISAQLTPEVDALRQPHGPARSASDEGLVDANPVITEPSEQPVLVRPLPDEGPVPRAIPVKLQEPNRTSTAAGKAYTVRSGDSLWGIAKRLKVDQASLMKANGINDPKKLRTGMILKVPQ